MEKFAIIASIERLNMATEASVQQATPRVRGLLCVTLFLSYTGRSPYYRQPVVFRPEPYRPIAGPRIGRGSPTNSPH